MRLLLDEHISPDVALALRAKGCDAVSVVDIGLRTEPDSAVWRRAIAEDRVVVTYDKEDFPRLFVESMNEGINNPGLVVVSPKTIPQNDVGGLARSLVQLVASAGDISNQMLYLRREERR